MTPAEIRATLAQIIMDLNKARVKDAQAKVEWLYRSIR